MYRIRQFNFRYSADVPGDLPVQELEMSGRVSKVSVKSAEERAV